MAADSRTDDDHDGDEHTDPWADIIGEDTAGATSAFDFSNLDEPSAPSTEDPQRDSLAAGERHDEASQGDDASPSFPVDDPFADLVEAAGRDGVEADAFAADEIATSFLSESQPDAPAETVSLDAWMLEAAGGDAGAGEPVAPDAEGAADVGGADVLVPADAVRVSAEEFSADDLDAPSVMHGDAAVDSRSSSTVEIGTGFSGLDLDDAMGPDDGQEADDERFAEAFAGSMLEEDIDSAPRETTATGPVSDDAWPSDVEMTAGDAAGWDAVAGRADDVEVAAFASQESFAGDGWEGAGDDAAGEDADGGEPNDPWAGLGVVAEGGGSDDAADHEAGSGEANDDDAFAVTAPVGTGVAVPVATGEKSPRRAAAKPKKGGAGQMLGIVLGGALSLPIVGLILIGITWLGGPDSLGMRRWLPGASFLMPARKAAGGGQSKSLDDLSTGGASVPAPAGRGAPPQDAFAVATGAVDADSPAESVPASPDPAAIAGDEPASAEPQEPAPVVPPAAPANDLAAPTDALAATDLPNRADPIGAIAVPDVDVAVAVAAPDLLAAIPQVPPLDAEAMRPIAPPAVEPEPAPPPAPEPEPLDMGPLDAAVDAALDASGRLNDTDAGGRERARGLVDWYRALAGVGEELAALEAVAVARGRPFSEAAPRLAPLMADVAPDGPFGADLERLARNWLAFSRRDRDGVVLPATFDSTRRVGPYWCSKVRIDEADGTTRDVAIISRQEPLADAGSRCLVLGVLFDGGVVWAADVRGEDGAPLLESDVAGDEPSGGDSGF